MEGETEEYIVTGTWHPSFLKRNGGAMAAILDATMPARPVDRLPLIDDLTILVGTDQVTDLLKVGTRNAWQRILRATPPETRSHWTAKDWARKLGHLTDFGIRAPNRLFSLYRVLAQRPDFPSIGRMRAWGEPRWRSLLRRIGCDPRLAGTITSLILDRSELPSGPLTSHLYGRLGYSRGHQGRPTSHDVLPEHVEGLKWRFQQLAAFRCTLEIQPGSTTCQSCPVRSFCRAYRKTQHPRRRFKTGFVDLFAGPGGISLGLSRAGLQLICAIEKDPHSADTLYLNHSEASESEILCVDLKRILRTPEILAPFRGIPVVAGGPPCQAFSMARRHSNADWRDPRRRLVFDFVKVAQQLDPLVVLMENVPGIQNAQEGEALASILRAFGRAGFAVSYRLLKATSFGIPQTRSRVFFIGVNRNRVKGAEKVLLRILRGIESASRSAGRLTVRQALSGLPRIMPGSGGFVITKRAPGRPTKYSRTMSKGSRLIFNHETRMHNPRDLAIFRELRWGETARKFEARNPGRVPYNLDSFGDKYRKLHPGKPSPTIPSHLKRDANSFVHPFVSRGITPREAARLQSFPDEYIFLGGMGPSFVQIGNAVPPLLAEVLGREIAKAVF